MEYGRRINATKQESNLITDPEMKLLVTFSETARVPKSQLAKSRKQKSLPSGSPAPRSRSAKMQIEYESDDEEQVGSNESQIRRSPRVVNMQSSLSLVNLKSNSVKRSNEDEVGQESSSRKSSRRVSTESSTSGMSLVDVDSISKKKAESSVKEKLSTNKPTKSVKRTRDQNDDSDALDILFDDDVKSTMRVKMSAKSSSLSSIPSPNPSAAMLKLNLSNSPATRKARAQTPTTVNRPTASQAAVASSLLTLSKTPASLSKANSEKQSAKRGRLIRLNASEVDSEDELDFETSQRSHASSPQMGRVGRAESPSW